MIERGHPLFAVIRITRKANNLEECSMFWIMLTVFPQTSSLRIKKLCYVFEDNEAVIKMIMKGRSPTIYIQIKYIDTKNPTNSLTPRTNSQTC